MGTVTIIRKRLFDIYILLSLLLLLILLLFCLFVCFIRISHLFLSVSRCDCDRDTFYFYAMKIQFVCVLFSLVFVFCCYTLSPFGLVRLNFTMFIIFVLIFPK